MFIAEHQSGDLWMYGDGLLKKKEFFFPETSGDGIFFPDIQSFFMEGISLQDVFSFEICTITFFFLKSPILPLKSQMVGS